MTLDKTTLAISRLSREIMLARFGKSNRLALERRVITTEALGTVAEYMMLDCPKGASIDVWISGKRHKLTVVPSRSSNRRRTRDAK
jgi:hypothetical protein